MRRDLSNTRWILALVLTIVSPLSVYAQLNVPESSMAAELYTTLASLPLAQEHLRSFGVGKILSPDRDAVIADAVLLLNAQQFESATVERRRTKVVQPFVSSRLARAGLSRIIRSGGRPRQDCSAVCNGW